MNRRILCKNTFTQEKGMAKYEYKWQYKNTRFNNNNDKGTVFTYLREYTYFHSSSSSGFSLGSARGSFLPPCRFILGGTPGELATLTLSNNNKFGVAGEGKLLIDPRRENFEGDSSANCRRLLAPPEGEGAMTYSACVPPGL